MASSLLPTRTPFERAEFIRDIEYPGMTLEAAAEAAIERAFGKLAEMRELEDKMARAQYDLDHATADYFSACQAEELFRSVLETEQDEAPKTNPLKALVVIGFMLFSFAAHAGEYTADQKEADDDLCAAFTSLVTTTHALQHERALESVGGVKDLVKSRELSEAFVRYTRNFFEANTAQEKAHGRVKNFHEDCENISAQDETDATNEVQRLAKAVK